MMGRDEDGHFKRLYDGTYDEAAEEWLKGLREFSQMRSPSQLSSRFYAPSSLPT